MLGWLLPVNVFTWSRTISCAVKIASILQAADEASCVTLLSLRLLSTVAMAIVGRLLSPAKLFGLDY